MKGECFLEGNVAKLECNSSLKNENAILEMAYNFVLNNTPLCKDKAQDIKVCISEAFHNSVKFGYGGKTTEPINIRLQVHKDYLYVVVRDTGVGIKDVQWAKQPLHTTGAPEHSGMGFTIMESFSSKPHFIVTSKPGMGTTVRMRFYWNGGGES